MSEESGNTPGPLLTGTEQLDIENRAMAHVSEFLIAHRNSGMLTASMYSLYVAVRSVILMNIGEGTPWASMDGRAAQIVEQWKKNPELLSVTGPGLPDPTTYSSGGSA